MHEKCGKPHEAVLNGLPVRSDAKTDRPAQKMEAPPCKVTFTDNPCCWAQKPWTASRWTETTASFAIRGKKGGCFNTIIFPDPSASPSACDLDAGTAVAAR